jgi:nucleotide-binding universal stress UspA family protein
MSTDGTGTARANDTDAEVGGTVVIALDGSPHSEQTLRWGMDEAVRTGAGVLLARVFRDPRELMEWGWYPVVTTDLQLDTDAKEYLEEHAERERSRYPGTRIETRLLHGAEVPELRRLSESARLLVVGAGGRPGHLRMGSVAAHLAAHARCSVAVVRDDGQAREVPVKPVLVGVDGSATSLLAATVAAGEAQGRGADLVVVHAHPTVADPFGRGMAATAWPDLGDDPEADAPTHRAARAVVDQLRAEHPELAVQVRLLDDDPVHALVTLAADASLVVVGSRGLGAFRGMLLGAVSNEVVRDAPCTVLVVHEPHAGGRAT